MKKVETTKRFKKNFRSRISSNPRLVQKLQIRLDLLVVGNKESVADHALHGDKLGLRAFSLTGDIRVIYRETDQSFELIDIGTHNQVY